MIWFVGAGPGDPKLVTLRGREYIEKADMIIYAGSLVNPKLLSYAKPSAEIHDSATLTLDEVIALMERAEKDKLFTVRLHTGDPSVYGAIAEQLRRLEEKGIAYGICPGVSSFSAAAAALGIEYTLPEETQTLILSRMEGKTSVPKREELSLLAEHGCSLVLFLSVGMVRGVQRRLLSEQSAYTPDTPCAIVYKASWPEQKIVRGRLGELLEMAEGSGIDKTALILIGEAVGVDDKKSDRKVSRLYDRTFSTGYRAAKGEHPIAVISFTDDGRRIADGISRAFSEAVCYAYKEDFSDTKTLVAELFAKVQVLIFVGATGIAVRMIAPHIQSKVTDPAVLCCDDRGSFVISLLSGHLGGANMWCKKIAAALGAVPVITTATDTHQVFAVDDFAREHHLVFEDTSMIKEVSSRLLKGEPVGLYTACGITLAAREDEPRHFEKECRLYPKNLFVGVGCKKGKSTEELFSFLQRVCDDASLPLIRIAAVCSIDQKKDEEGISRMAEKLKVPFMTFSADRLREVKGNFLASDFVEETVGVDNVCERSAVCAAGEQGILRITKQVEDGMTLAVAERTYG